jgi:hypothetical protein
MSEQETERVPAPERRFVFWRIDGVRLRALPLMIALFLALAILILSPLIVDAIEHFIWLPDRPANPWMRLFYEHAAQLLLTLLAIRAVKTTLPGDYGFRLPPKNSYVPSAIFFGLLFGGLMTLADYVPQIIAHKPPQGLFQLTPLNVGGWLSYKGLFVGLTDEPFLRGLLVTYLMARIAGRITFLNFKMHIAGLLVASFYALTYLGNFFIHPWWMALAQMATSFLLGVLFAYWFEKSRSLLAPVVGHNVSAVTEYGLIFAMVANWH